MILQIIEGGDLIIKQWKEDVFGYLFLAPALIVLSIFILIPIFYSLGLSFVNWDMMRPNAKFVGLDNYAKLFSNADFYNSLRLTGLYALMTVPTTIVISLLFAFLLDHGTKATKLVYRSIFFSPMITSTVAISAVWIFIYQPDYGVMNRFVEALGFERLLWLNSTDTALISLSIMAVWKNLGFCLIVLLAGLQAVPASLEEAARVDGASLLRIIFSVKLPLLTPSIFLLVILSSIDQIQTFTQIHVMTQGGPAKSTELIVSYLWRYAFERFEMGYASTVAIVILLITLLLALLQMAVMSKRVHYQ